MTAVAAGGDLFKSKESNGGADGNKRLSKKNIAAQTPHGQ